MAAASDPASSKSFSAKTGKIGYLQGMNCIELSSSQMKSLGLWKKQRLICTVNGLASFSCGILPRAGGGGYIMLNKKHMKSAGCLSGDTIKVQLVPDTSRYGMPMPEELEEVLDQDPVGKDRFEKLTPGKQRNIIHFINSVKSSQLRIERALKLIGNLSTLPEGKETVRRIFGYEE
jgi:Bacteriocin-protection, YdeI or OmpD-Associated/Domain of unknown function (DUF1905)